MPKLFSRLLSLGSDKPVKEFERIASHIDDLEPDYQKM